MFESAHHSAILTPFCVDSNGSFAPRDPIFNAGGRLDPTPIINAVFRNGKAASKEGRIPFYQSKRVSFAFSLTVLLILRQARASSTAQFRSQPPAVELWLKRNS